MQAILMNYLDRLIASMRVQDLDINEVPSEVAVAREEFQIQRAQLSSVENLGTEVS
jgi:hypothetical protein